MRNLGTGFQKLEEEGTGEYINEKSIPDIKIWMIAFFFLIDGLDYFFLWLQLRLFHERIIFHEAWEQSFTNLTHFVYNTRISDSVDCKGTKNYFKSWQWTMNDNEH